LLRFKPTGDGCPCGTSHQAERQELKKKRNKLHNPTTTNRPVSMIFFHYNFNPVIDARRRW
jgi:hypothetical protein